MRVRLTALAWLAPAAVGFLVSGALVAAGSGLIDPLSVAALGALTTLVGLVLRALADRSEQVPRARRIAARAVLGSIAVLVIWVAANRAIGLPTGSLKPSNLLLVGIALATAALAMLEWERAALPVGRTAGHWYRTYAACADALNLWLVVVAAALLRAAIMFRAPAFVIGDSGVFVETATTILDDFSFAPLGAVFPPLYSLFLTAIRLLLGPDFLAVVAVQHALGAVSAAYAYRLGRAFLPAPLAVLPALVVATNGYLIILEHGIYSEALFVPLTLLFAVATMRLYERHDVRSAAVAGGLLGLAALTRLVIQFAVPLVALLLALHGGWRRSTARQVVAFVGAFALVVAPWVAHNWVKLGYVGLSNSLGMQVLPRLWEEEGGYEWELPAASGTADPLVRQALRSLQEEKDRGASWWDAWQRIEREFPERDSSALVTAAVLDVIRRQPQVYVDRTWFRLKRMWGGGFTKERVNDLYGQQEALDIRSPIFAVRDDREVADLDEREGNKVDAITRWVRPDRLPERLTLGLTTAAIVGGLFSRRLRPALLPLGLGMGLLALPVLINADRARYLHPAEPFLLVSYAAGAWGVVLGAQALTRRLNSR